MNPYKKYLNYASELQFNLNLFLIFLPEPSMKYGPLPSLNSLEFLPELFKSQIERNFTKTMTPTNCSTTTTAATTTRTTTISNNDILNSTAGISCNNSFSNLLLADMVEPHQTFSESASLPSGADTTNANEVYLERNADEDVTNIRDVSNPETNQANDDSSLNTNLTNVKVYYDKVNMVTKLVDTTNSRLQLNADADADGEADIDADEGSKLNLPKSTTSDEFDESLRGTNMGVVGGGDGAGQSSGVGSLKVRDEFVELKNQSGKEMRAGDNDQLQQQQSCRGQRGTGTTAHRHHLHPQQQKLQSKSPPHHHQSKNCYGHSKGFKRGRSHIRDGSEDNSHKPNCLVDDNKASDEQERKESDGGGRVAKSDVGVEVRKTMKFPSVNETAKGKFLEKCSSKIVYLLIFATNECFVRLLIFIGKEIDTVVAIPPTTTPRPI